MKLHAKQQVLKTNSYTFDLNNAVPYRDTSYGKRDEIWANNIHFTPKGYDLIGSLLADRIIGLMKEPSARESGMGKLELLKMRSPKTRREENQVVEGKQLRSGRVVV